MNKICLLLLFFSFALSVSAQDSELEKYAPEIKEISDPDFEWTLFNNKKAKCQFRKNSLELECRENGEYACTFTELDIDPNNVNFIMTFQFEVDKLDDTHCSGIVFDYKNIKNFQALCFGKKQFTLLSYENGEEAIVKEGLYKLDNKKNLTVTIQKRGKRLDFYFGSQYLSLTTLKNCEISNSSVGFYVKNKTKIRLSGFGYRVILPAEEESE